MYEGERSGIHCPPNAATWWQLLKVLQPSTKGFLSVSPQNHSGSLKEDEPIPSAVTSARGDPPTGAHKVAA